jgi:hypothetical protein
MVASEVALIAVMAAATAAIVSVIAYVTRHLRM